MKKRMKDRPGLLDDAQRIAEAGRGNDNARAGGLVAHITAEEAALLKARGGSGTINPKTGLLEFMSEQDPMGGAADYGYGDNSTPETRGAMENATNDMVGAMNAAATAPNYMEEAQAAQYSPRSAPQQIADYVSHGFREMMNNPARTGINALTSLTGLGIPNTIMGFVNPDLTVGGLMTSSARALTEYDGKKAETVAALGEPDGPQSPSEPPGNDANRVSDAPLSPQQVASQTTPTQVAQDALRRAFMVNPGLLNQWQGNQFMAGGTAGKPNAYNQWQGNQLYRPPVFPGLIG